ncbi:MAG: hypothetical protein PHW31_01060 [Candidatus Pacebacteria bacterium]|nr:hypothetical protein [Candidatus Paceibacterota bacterium]
MAKKLTTTQLIAIGALAALYTILSLPGAIIAGLTGMWLFSAIANIVVIGIMYPLVPLLFKRVGAVTLWALIVGIIFIPLPLGGPPGFLPKVVYMAFWGLFADFVYLLFKRSEKISAILIGATQIGLGGIITVYLWNLLGAPKLAAQSTTIASYPFIIAGSIVGGIMGFIAYLIYKKARNTLIIRRIQGE